MLWALLMLPRHVLLLLLSLQPLKSASLLLTGLLPELLGNW